MVLLAAGAFGAVQLRSAHPAPQAAGKDAPSHASSIAGASQVAGKPLTGVRLASGASTKAVAGELLVKIPDPAAARALGSEVTPAGPPQTYLLKVPAGQALDQAAAAATERPGVAAASPNYVVTKAAVPNDPLYGSYQWNLGKIAAPAAWDRTTGNSATVIASLDTGVNHNHQDLAAKSWTNSAEIDGNGLDDDANGYVDDYRGMDFVGGTLSGSTYVNDANGPIDDEGHGSLTASVFAGASNNGLGVAAVNWNAKVMAVKVLDTEGVGTFLDVANGIRYAAQNGAKVINMSLGAQGVTSDFATDEAISYATSRGSVLVGASGNDGSASTISYPAINPNVIAVGATDGNDNRASYSNAGPQLSVVAPGNGIAGADAVMDKPSGVGLNVQTSVGATLTPGAYRYAVTALNANGETVSATRPAASGGGRVDVGAAQEVTMNWAATFGATGYKVYRSPVNGADGSQKLLATLGSGATSYTDTGAASLGAQSPPAVNSALLNSSYSTASGTSLATPHVAGVVGLLAGIKPNLTSSQARSILQSSADKVPGMNGAARTDLYGSGRLNAQRALASLPSWSATYAGQSANPTTYSGDETTLYVDYRNSGSETWSNQGPNPVRLGTSHPKDRGSGLRSSQWLDAARPGSFSGRVEAGGTVTASDTVAPGETARFEVRIKAPNVAAPVALPEYFQPVVEGVQWMEDYGMFWNVIVKPAAMKYSAAYAGQSAPATILEGETSTVYIDYRNNGPASWSNGGANPVRLGTSHPMDRGSGFATAAWIDPARPATFTQKVEADGSLTATATIAPGETARFAFEMKAPFVNQTTPIREYFQPVAEGIRWMEDYGAYQEPTVVNQTYQYAYAGQTAPVSLQVGQRAPATLDLTNTGTATWKRTGANPLRLGTGRPLDRASGFYNDSWLSPGRPGNFSGKVSGGAVVSQDTIAPGETARFSFDLVAPNRGGAYREYVNPVLEGVGWLADIGIYYDVTVTDPAAATYDYAYAGQNVGIVTLAKDAQTTFKLQLRNTGGRVWNSGGATPFRLGTDHPRDRGSGFSNGSWLSPSRIKLTRNLTDGSKNVGGETTIGSGETGEFEFTVTGAPPPGTYQEFFTPVVEGVAWQRDIGINWTVVIQKPISVGLAQQSSFTATSTGTTTVKTAGGQTLTTVGAGGSMTVSAGNGYSVSTPNGTFSSSSQILLDQAPGAVATVANLADNASFNRFRGILLINVGSPGTYLVNLIDAEEYLRGLGEVPDSWPIESIKAQVVAARTYAGRKMASPPNDIFNLYDDTRDQVYNGYNNEAAKPNHVTAINATKGVALYYQGNLAQAYYSSDTGGASESNENVWGGSPIPYLRGVADPYQKPDVWSKTVSQATLQANFGLPGNVDAINVLAAYPSGRTKTVRFTVGGQAHDRTYTADTMRSKFTLRSSMLTGLGRSGNDWVISGRGFGHGIGMGQWGAYNQAAQGRSYQQILGFYYTGTNLGTLY